MKIKKTMKSSRKVSHFLKMMMIVLFCNFTAQAQEIVVQGTVKSVDDGFPIPGATVLVKGTKASTVTNFDGEYSIKAKMGDLLVFSYIGMMTKNVPVNGKFINVTMKSRAQELDDVVVIGYGTVKKKELTGAVSQLKSDDIERFITPDLGSAMQGQIAGVNITANSGEPGEQSSIQIRGITSLSGSNTPLFVVDGIPQEGDPRLSSNEIETIDVLKDAASAAVYGTRGAAGVVLITTKRGKDGAMKVDFNTTYGVQRLGPGTPLMDASQQLYFEVQQKNNYPSAFDPGPTRPEWLTNDNDLRDIVLVNDAESKTYNLNISGGNKNITYNVAGGYFNADGVLIGSNFKRYNGRASTTYKSEHWKIDTSIGFIIEDRDRATNGLITNAIRYKPYFPIVDNTSDTFYTESGQGGVETPLNQLAQDLRRKDNQRNDKINLSLSVTRDITKDLKFTTRLGTNVDNSIRNIFRPRYELVDLTTGSVEVDPLKSGVAAFASRLNVFSWDGILNYKKTFGKHNLDLVATASLDERTFQEFNAARNGVISNEVEVINNAGQDPSAYSGINYVRKNEGFMGRIQYNYAGKYLLSIVGRRDGSSKFGSDKRWGTFPSVSAAWNVSDEKFWEPLNGTVNNFKIRLSRGTVGNDNFDDYQFASVISGRRNYIFDVNDTNLTLGSAVVSYANPEVKWETSISNNLGVDLAFFKNKFTLTADYYVTKKKDMLFPVRLPGSTGVVQGQEQDVILNIGNMTNKGLEIGANYREKIGKSSLNLGVTFTRNRNEITKIVDGVDIIYNPNSQVLGSAATVFKVGHEAASFWLYQTAGTLKTDAEVAAYNNFSGGIATKGDLRYVDQLTEDTNNDGIPDAGDGVLNDKDRVYSGSGLPDFEMGFNLNWTYKNFDLAMNWYATVGAEIINGTKADAYARFRHADLVNMWTLDNPTSNIPLVKDRDHPNARGITDQFVENGDYLRLKLVTLGYTFSKQLSNKMGINKLRLYLSAQNPLTITGYDGYDPEIGGNNIAQRGLDLSRYPLTSLYSFGVNVSF
ncbi:TonB-dependent receptor [Flavobacterium sp. NG2]|uniref:SusC/RagA family TonB-linked outer membrane protein n=1 Tax=Flavobacterium sp. NG2 TaxID=3097547 RepID=UPI002A7FA147|nr:TonB-dependent receptor [Flavobacterium sp. NG2]WPR71408.1 TonB-dependent receptor [Flavobacterium sp. NG2]